MARVEATKSERAVIGKRMLNRRCREYGTGPGQRLRDEPYSSSSPCYSQVLSEARIRQLTCALGAGTRPIRVSRRCSCEISVSTLTSPAGLSGLRNPGYAVLALPAVEGLLESSVPSMNFEPERIAKSHGEQCQPTNVPSNPDIGLISFLHLSPQLHICKTVQVRLVEFVRDVVATGA